MRIAMVGLGKMGSNMTLRLLRSGHEVVASEIDRSAVDRAVEAGAIGAYTLEEAVARLEPPRAVWVMVPSGGPTEQVVSDLGDLLAEGDVVIDGGNSLYTDTVRRAEEVARKGIDLIDCGTSGGVWGLEEGYCLMIGSEAEPFQRLVPIFEALAPQGGYAHLGRPGAGHFVKMVHNGIEYALMQGYAEGFQMLRDSDIDLDLAAVAEVWRHGSVIRSWLLDLAAAALRRDPNLDQVTAQVADSGEGRWTVKTAVDNAIPTPTIALSLFARFASRQDEAFSNKLLSALRREFGGHQA